VRSLLSAQIWLDSALLTDYLSLFDYFPARRFAFLKKANTAFFVFTGFCHSSDNYQQNSNKEEQNGCM